MSDYVKPHPQFQDKFHMKKGWQYTCVSTVLGKFSECCVSVASSCACANTCVQSSAVCTYKVKLPRTDTAVLFLSV